MAKRQKNNSNTLTGTEIIEKRNILNELRANDMSLQELRFFSIYLAKINPRYISTRVVRFPLSEFQKIMELGKVNTQYLRASINSLLCKVVNIPTPSGGMTAFQLFKECTLDLDNNGKWYVEIDANDKALPLMFDFKREYFQYELWNALGLKSANQLRMYEILKQYENLGTREIEISKLRELIGISSKKYKRWDNFKKEVLDTCQQALSAHTDICFTYERGQTGRGGSWLTIIFHISKNPNHVDRLSLSEFIDKQSNSEPLMLDDTSHTQEQIVDQPLTSDKYDYSDEKTRTYAAVCDNRYSQEQMTAIIAAVEQIPVTGGRREDKILESRCEYLKRQYTKMLSYSKNPQSHGYLLSMIENDKTSKISVNDYELNDLFNITLKNKKSVDNSDDISELRETLPKNYIVEGDPDVMAKMLDYSKRGIRSISIIPREEYNRIMDLKHKEPWEGMTWRCPKCGNANQNSPRCSCGFKFDLNEISIHT